MKPSELAQNLRQIASKIDKVVAKGKSVSASRVSADLKKIVATISRVSVLQRQEDPVITVKLDANTTLFIRRDQSNPADHLDPSTAAMISEKARNNVWAWFEAEVETTDPATGKTGSGFAPGLSFENINDFKRSNEFLDTVEASRDALQDVLHENHDLDTQV